MQALSLLARDCLLSIGVATKPSTGYPLL